MTFEEALAVKKSIGETIIKTDMTFHILVAPQIESELQYHFHTYNTSFTDYYAKDFSSNGKFQVVGYYFDGSNRVIDRIQY